jgi:hypothetical protein
MVPEENKFVVSPSRADIVGMEDATLVHLDVKLAQLRSLRGTCGEVVQTSIHSGRVRRLSNSLSAVQ